MPGREISIAPAWLLGWLLVAACQPAGAEASDRATPDRPNVVFILVDDLTWADVGYRWILDTARAIFGKGS